MITQSESERAKIRKRIWLRFPIAILVLYLFTSSYFASPWTGTGFALTMTFVALVGATLLFRVTLVAAVINWPLYYYMGRNNFLWAWLLFFTLTSTVMWVRTEPDDLPKRSVSARSDDSVSQTASRELASNLEQLDQKYTNYRESGRLVTNQERQLEITSRWYRWDQRFIYTMLLWPLLVIYFPFAFWDEFRDGFKKVWQKVPAGEGTTRPMFAEAAANMLGIPGPMAAMAATAAAASQAVPNKFPGFWVQVLQETIAQAFTNLLPGMRRR